MLSATVIKEVVILHLTRRSSGEGRDVSDLSRLSVRALTPADLHAGRRLIRGLGQGPCQAQA